MCLGCLVTLKTCKTTTLRLRGLGGLAVTALNLQAEGRGFEPRSDEEDFQTIGTPSSYSTWPGLNIKWTKRRFGDGQRCAWVIPESTAVCTNACTWRMCLGCLVELTFTTLWTNSADDKLIFFPRKKDLTFHANCLHWRQFAWNVKSYFLRKIRKNISKCRLLKTLIRVLPVKNCMTTTTIQRRHDQTRNRRWGLTTCQPLWVFLCRLPEKGRREIEEIVEEMKVRDSGERKMSESEEKEEIISFTLYPYLLQG